MHKIIRGIRSYWVITALIATAPQLALARNAVDVEVRGTVKQGERPAVILVVNQPLRAVELRVKAAGAHAPKKPVHITKSRLRPGKRVELALPPQQKAGVIEWTGTLRVVFSNGSEGSMPLAFTTQSFASIQIKMTREDLDLENHQMTFRSDRELREVSAIITGDDGEDVAHIESTIVDQKAGEPITLSWTPRTPSPVLRIQLRATDAAGFHQQVDYYPWQIHIPHEEVLFSSGSAEIPPEEEPKLKAVLPLIQQTQKRYGKAIQMTGESMKLFIAGHTDTVGKRSYNQQLSRQRAASIADWFKGNGVDMLIYFRGFGESQPKVNTPDEMPEAQNRRGDYTLALQSPTDGLNGWKRLP